MHKVPEHIKSGELERLSLCLFFNGYTLVEQDRELREICCYDDTKIIKIVGTTSFFKIKDIVDQGRIEALEYESSSPFGRTIEEIIANMKLHTLLVVSVLTNIKAGSKLLHFYIFVVSIQNLKRWILNQ